MRLSSFLMAAMFVAACADAEAQNWRRQGGSPPSTSRTDPSASSDIFNPQEQWQPQWPQQPQWQPQWPQQPQWQPQWPQQPQWQPQWPQQPQWQPQRPQQPQWQSQRPQWPQQQGRKFLGVNISSTSTGQGVYVTNVVPNSAAFRVGIERGDVIYSIDGIQTNSPQELTRAIQFSDGFVEIFLRDVRTGQTIQRNADIRQ